MEPNLDTIWNSFLIFFYQAKNYLTEPWAAYQLAIIGGCFAVAWLLSFKIEPIVESRARNIKGNPGLLRIVIAFMRRLEWVFFLILVYIAREIVLLNTWPSRTFVLTAALVLGSAWLALAVLTRIIQNRTIARVIAIGAFAYIALGVLDIRDPVAQALDDAAINLGDFKLSILFVLRIIFLTSLFLWLATLFGTFFDNRINAISDLSPSFKVLSGKIVKVGLIVIALVVALTAAGLDLTTLTIFSGAVGIGLGFGLQKVVSNFISGVIILVDKSIKPGDTIELGDTFGWIRELRARFVSVITRDGREYLIPNEDFITQQVVNWSFSNKLVRLDVEFGVSYDSDPHEVTRIAIEAAKDLPRVLNHKAPVCWMTAFGASSLDFKLRFWIGDPQQGLTNIRGQVLLALWDAFQENGIGIPYPHREVIFKTPLETKQGN
ncbi:mechanosensitive ion channel family protein [Ahrensia marina]|uniref:Mechanosensitive ion channel protein n=1 Tax=Ahrensia marina TaxID=1514904 RepID=A0A0M9GMG2_9HYPH|nr:mechanosensitive ion channel domain-containing protein [Ahrensia marina]KPB01203.1 mechanosensitive ion channel protein [Ahrensia marina]